MQIITLDFETFFDTESGYTLKKITTEAYVRDHRFFAHGCAIKKGKDGKVFWLEAQMFDDWVARTDWANTAVLCHNAHFDGLILSHVYDIRPRVYFCTLSMARLLLGNHIRAGLDSLANHFGLAGKSVPYNLFDGKKELSADVQRQVAFGAMHDVELTWQIFSQHLAPYFPLSEYRMVDMTVRMFTEPMLLGSTPDLEKAEAAERERKVRLLEAAGVDDPKELRSNEIFASLLRDAGVDPETKPGKTGPIYAFAKTDRFMEDLLSSDDEKLEALAEARLAVSSSITETRARRLVDMSRRGALCFYLHYAGANTTRWSGGDKINPQNLTPEIQAAIEAPDGYELVVADASQIELRILSYMAGQWDVLERLRTGEDQYAATASAFYGRTITKEKDPVERQVGKVLELQCGFGSGGDKIAHTLRVRAGIKLDAVERLQARDAYRNTHPAVVNYWHQAERMLPYLANSGSIRWGPMEISDGCIWLPNGAPLIYDTLEYHKPVDPGEENPPYWRVKRRSGWQKLYGAKLVENAIQALARVYISEVCGKILERGLRIVLMRHDDVVICAKSDTAQDVFEWVKQEMRKPPAWAPDIPLDVGGHVGKRLK